MEQTPLQYHEWLEREFPVGSRVAVLSFQYDGRAYRMEAIGTVVGHPFEWEDDGDAESGPSPTCVEIGLDVKVLVYDVPGMVCITHDILRVIPRGPDQEDLRGVREFDNVAIVPAWMTSHWVRGREAYYGRGRGA